MRVGSCQATTVPGRTPMSYSPAATRSARSRSSPKVRERSSWRRTGRSGVRAARRVDQLPEGAGGAQGVVRSSFTAVPLALELTASQIVRRA